MGRVTSCPHPEAVGYPPLGRRLGASLSEDETRGSQLGELGIASAGVSLPSSCVFDGVDELLALKDEVRVEEDPRLGLSLRRA